MDIVWAGRAIGFGRFRVRGFVWITKGLALGNRAQAPIRSITD